MTHIIDLIYKLTKIMLLLIIYFAFKTTGTLYKQKYELYCKWVATKCQNRNKTTIYMVILANKTIIYHINTLLYNFVCDINASYIYCRRIWGRITLMLIQNMVRILVHLFVNISINVCVKLKLRLVHS